MNKRRALAGIASVAVVAVSVGANLAQAPTQTSVRVWTKTDSLAYARDKMEEFAGRQFTCLANLWGKESGWDPSAYNLVRSMGMRAGGIPQVLGMSPKTAPASQIDRGLVYIYYRYGTPCAAWGHWQRKGWY
jgi:hypothetical protein